MMVVTLGASVGVTATGTCMNSYDSKTIGNNLINRDFLAFTIWVVKGVNLGRQKSESRDNAKLFLRSAMVGEAKQH